MGFKGDFPQTSNFTYLNTASVGLLPKKTVEEVKKFVELEEAFGSIYWSSWEEEVVEARKSIAELIGASSEEIALVSNTSHGLNIVANGINWKRGENIVLNDLEFPANVFPWQNQARINELKLRIARSVNGKVPMEEYEKLVDDETRVLAVSWVEYSNGFRHDLKALAEIAHRHGAYFVVDGIQGVGMLKLDVGSEEIDFLACGCSKWLISPIGTGFLYIRKALLDELKVAFAGWRSDRDPDKFSLREFTPSFSARRFEEGAPNFIGIHGMLTSINYMNDVGIGRIEDIDLDLARKLVDYLNELNVRVVTPLIDGEPRSAIVSFKAGRINEIQSKLRGERIVTSVRSGAIRVSPHFYNDEEDLRRLVNIVRGSV